MKRNIRIMYLLALLQGLVFYAPVATLYRQARGLTISQITLIEGISLALTLICEFPWGVVADKIGYRKTMLFCNGLYLVSKLIFWRADGFPGFLIERVLLAVVCAGLSGVDTSILYLSCEKEESQKVFSIYNNCGRMGLLIAAGLYTLLMSKNYDMAGWTTAATYGIAFVLTFGLAEVKNEGNSNVMKLEEIVGMWPQLLKKRHLLMLVLSVALLTEVEHTVTVFLNQVQYVRCGMTDSQISVVYIVMTLAGLLGFFSDRGTKRLGHRAFGCILIAGSILSCVILIGTESAVLSVVAILVVHISFSLFRPLELELQNREVCTENRATELSMNSVLIDAIGVFITVVLGTAAEVDIRVAMAVGAVLSGGAFVLFYFSQKKMKMEWPES